MAEVLVLVEHVDGTVKKVTHELLALAARLGEPAAVLVGSGADAAIPALAEHGAATVYVAAAPELAQYAVTPTVAVLAALVGLLSRLRDARLGRRFHFPEVHVGTRFGAPYGGGVTSEIATQVGTH